MTPLREPRPAKPPERRRRVDGRGREMHGRRPRRLREELGRYRHDGTPADPNDSVYIVDKIMKKS